MQQLLGDKVDSTDGSFIRELFLQRLPTKVRMVLASSKDTVTTRLDELAQLADKLRKVTTPSVSAASVSDLNTELERLHAEVALLRILVQSLSAVITKKPNHCSKHSRSRLASPHNATVPQPCWFHNALSFC